MSEANSTNPHRYEFDPESGVAYCKLDFMGFAGYRVGDDGTIWSRWGWSYLGRYGSRATLQDKWFLLATSPGRSGHLRVQFRQGRVRHLVHRLVLLVFVGLCPEGMESCHFPDKNPANNSLLNLRWDTKKANAADRFTHGTDQRGEGNSQAKLTDEKVRSMREDYAAGGVSFVSLARKYDINEPVAFKVVHRKAWSHVK